MFPAVSARKQTLRRAASSCVSGGTSRVFDAPARGALIIIASAQPPPTAAGADGASMS
jgi:hypothetical protein